MSVNLDALVQWFQNRKGKLTYSMFGSRNGSDGTADCSGAMTEAIYRAGGTKYSYLYSTETLHDYLTANGFKLIAQTGQEFNPIKGDICILGKRGYSAGAAGHTMVFTGTVNQISVCYWTGGQLGTAVQEMPFDTMWDNSGKPYYYIYRLQGGSKPTTPSPAPTQSGSWIKETGTYKPNSQVNLRTGTSTSDKSIAIIKGGVAIKYDAYCFANGLIWIRQPRENGKYGYLATGNATGTKRTSTWGTFY